MVWPHFVRGCLSLLTSLGVRNLVARNRMRAMRKGDLAFFYHSNTKVPGVAGIMEIVEEHSIDGTPIKADLRAYILTSDCRICL